MSLTPPRGEMSKSTFLKHHWTWVQNPPGEVLRHFWNITESELKTSPGGVSKSKITESEFKMSLWKFSKYVYHWIWFQRSMGTFQNRNHWTRVRNSPLGEFLKYKFLNKSLNMSSKLHSGKCWNWKSKSDFKTLSGKIPKSRSPNCPDFKIQISKLSR